MMMVARRRRRDKRFDLVLEPIGRPVLIRISRPPPARCIFYNQKKFRLFVQKILLLLSCGQSRRGFSILSCRWLYKRSSGRRLATQTVGHHQPRLIHAIQLFTHVSLLYLSKTFQIPKLIIHMIYIECVICC